MLTYDSCMSKVPPSDAHRVALFLELVDEYDDLAAALPVQERSLRIGAEVSGTDHWHRLLRAFALRKFIAPTDQVTIAKVAESLSNLLPTNPSFVDDMQRLADEAMRGVAAYGTHDGSYDHADEVMRDLLYGRYLHSDYGKWQAAAAAQRAGFVTTHAVWSWTTNVESLVRRLANDIRQLVASGDISIPMLE